MSTSHHGRYAYRPIVDRPDYDWPDGRRLAIYFGVNYEVFDFGGGLGPELAPAQTDPDVMNYAWRDYGNRVGAWRLFDLFDRLGLRTTALLNADAEHGSDVLTEETQNNVGAGLPAIAVCQLAHLALIHCYRRQASSYSLIALSAQALASSEELPFGRASQYPNTANGAVASITITVINSGCSIIDDTNRLARKHRPNCRVFCRAAALPEFSAKGISAFATTIG